MTGKGEPWHTKEEEDHFEDHAKGSAIGKLGTPSKRPRTNWPRQKGPVKTAPDDTAPSNRPRQNGPVKTAPTKGPQT
jgi:hypothetical protein